MASPEVLDRRAARPLSAPSSPSKRPQRASHYDALQASPSKKRTLPSLDLGQAPPGPAFGGVTRSADIIDLPLGSSDDEDDEPPVIQRPTIHSRKKRTAKS